MRRRLHGQYKAWSDLDPPIRKFVAYIALIAVFLAGALSISAYRAFITPAPVVTYGFEPLKIGVLDETGAVVASQVNGLPAVEMHDGLVTVPVVFARCSDQDASALSQLTILADVGMDRPTLIPRDNPANLDIKAGCTGTIGVEVVFDAPPMSLIKERALFSLRFRLSADGLRSTTVETEQFVIVEEGVLS